MVGEIKCIFESGLFVLKEAATNVIDKFEHMGNINEKYSCVSRTLRQNFNCTYSTGKLICC